MIDLRYLDYDFPRDPRYVRGDNGAGCLRHRFAHYADEAVTYPESQWPELAKMLAEIGGGCAQLVTRIYDQKQEGSCVANACSQAHEIVQARQRGKENVVHLSAISLYKRIGRSAGSGAVVSDGLEEMAEHGILPLNDEANKARFAHTMPNTGFGTPFPGGWEATAAMFKASEWLVIDEVDELISALFNQFPVVVGRSGHSICYCDPLYKDGALLVKYANSWGDWGENGFGYDSLGKIKSSSNWAFAIRSVTVPNITKKQ